MLMLMLLLNHLRLIFGHELLGMLIRVCQLAAALVVEILLRTAIAMCGLLAERGVSVRPLTEISFL